jgi:hypothetical protein
MSTPNTPHQQHTLAGPLALASLLLVAAVGFGVYRAQLPPEPTVVTEVPSELPLMMTMTAPPSDTAAPSATSLHNVEFEMRNGTRIVKIQLHAAGDEIIVDATTGRFIEKRTAYLPMIPAGGGKFAAPHDPMM